MDVFGGNSAMSSDLDYLFDWPRDAAIGSVGSSSSNIHTAAASQKSPTLSVDKEERDSENTKIYVK